MKTLSLKEIYQPIAQDMGSFDAMIRKELTTDDPFLADLARYLVEIAGKRMRPALAILSSRYTGDTSDIPVRLGLAIELLHSATLVHDDIVDGSHLRRNQKSLNARWGTEISIICGDYLYAKAFLVLAGLEHSRLFRLLSECAQKICEGELRQIQTRSDLALPEAAYLDIIYKKTASLFEAASLVGPTLQPAHDGYREILGEYGTNLGLAFQITDDCLDMVGDEQTLGKSVGLDMERCDVTLPLIYLYESLKKTDRAPLEEWVSGKGSQDHFAAIKSLAMRHGAVERSMDLARDHARRASEVLERLPDSALRKSLADLTEYVINRVS